MVRSKQYQLGKTLLGIGLMTACAAGAWAADTVSGVARNMTNAQFASGDQAILIRLDHAGRGVAEEARARIDSAGAFAFTVKDAKAIYLVRVVHQGVNYDQHVAVNKPVAIAVFDATTKARDVAGTLEVIRIGSKGGSLHVSDMMEIRNDSSPRLTQTGKRGFEVWLPAQAQISSVLASGEENIGVKIHATPVPGDPGHYAVDFPLRPGSTKFAFNYDLPYSGSIAFRARNFYPLKLLTVMIPPTMKFTSPSASFQPLATGDKNYLVEAAQNPKPGRELTFQVSGAGPLPALAAPPPPSAAPEQRVLSAPQPPVSTLNTALAPVPTPQPESKWGVLGASVALLLAICGFGLWLLGRRRRSASALPTSEPARTPSDSPVEALKEVLFQLETDRVRGAISGEDYANSKRALEGMVMRTIAPTGTAQVGETTPSLTS